MKKWILLPVALLAITTFTFAQGTKTIPQKIGFASLRNVLDSLPMKDSAVAQLKILNDYFQDDLSNMKKEYETKLEKEKVLEREKILLKEYVPSVLMVLTAVVSYPS